MDTYSIFVQQWSFFIKAELSSTHVKCWYFTVFIRISESIVKCGLKRYEIAGDADIAIPEKQDATIQSMLAQHSTESVGQISFRLSKKDIKISKDLKRLMYSQ